MSRPAIRNAEPSNWPSGSPSSARPALASWKACWPVAATARTRRNAFSRWRCLSASRCARGAGAGRAATAPSPWRPCNASWRHGASPRHRWMRWPTTIGPTWTGCSRRDPTPPRPTSDYQDLLREEPDHGEAIIPPWEDMPERPQRGDRDDGLGGACMTTSPPRCERWAFPLTQPTLDAALSAAEKESLSHLEFLHRLLAGPAEARRQRAIERRIREAKFRELTTLEGFDWEFNAKGVDRRTIEQLATCDFVRRHENVVLVGQTGPGQEPDPPGDGPRRVRAGLQRPVRDQRQAASGIHRGVGRRDLCSDAGRLRSLDLLLIDEFGFDRLEREAQAQASTFYYRLLDARTGRRSTALATNIDFKAWADYLGDPPLATAFLDRLVDGAVILKLTGRSYRAHRARPAVEAEAAD